MKKLFALLTLAVLACGILPHALAQIQVGSSPLQQATGVPWQMGGAWSFTLASGSTAAFPIKGLSYYKIVFTPVGTVSGCSLSVDSAASVDFNGNPVSPSTGGIISAASIGSCATAGSYSNATPAGISNFGLLTPTITGTGSVTVTMFGYIQNPAASAAAAIASPTDVSGYVEVNCKTGCGSTTLGQAAMAASLPVAIATNQSAVPVSGGVTTQPTGFGALVGFQQAVTASAVALSTNSSHSFCVAALPANTINVFVGPSGVTTATGFPLQPGQTACWSLSNTNLVFVIASTTGASVAVTGT